MFDSSTYFGAGFSPAPEDGMEIRPIPVRDGNGNALLLSLAFRDEEYADGAPLNTAVITAVPEPSAIAFGVLTPGSVVGFIAHIRKS